MKLVQLLVLMFALGSITSCVRDGRQKLKGPDMREDDDSHDYPTSTEVPPAKIRYEIP